MFTLLGRIVAAHPWKICAAWFLFGLAVTLAAPPWDNRAQDDDIHFLPAHCDSVRGYQLLERAFPQDVFASRAILAVERPGGPLTADDLALVDDLVADLNRLREEEPGLQINQVVSLRDPFIGIRLISADRQCTLIQVSLATPYLALQTRATVDRIDKRVRPRLAMAGDKAPSLFTTGPAGIGRDLTSASADSLENTTLATIVLVVVILLFVYRAPLLALVPLATIAGSVWVAVKLLALCSLIPGFYLVHISKVFAVVMLYGAGTDYCLFLISRYREELSQGHSHKTGLARSLAVVGGALAASAGTVVSGLSLMGCAEFAKVRCGGPAIAVSLVVALLASLTLAPALLRLLGRVVFWPGPQPGPVREERAGAWDWISRLVVARPVAIWVLTVALLCPLAVLGFRTKVNHRATGELSPTSDSVRGLAVIQSHFTAGELGPITVLLEAPFDWTGKEARGVIAHLSQGLLRLENVAEVRSLTQPLGTPLNDSPAPIQGLLARTLWNNLAQGVTDQVNRSAREHYVARVEEGGPRYVTRLDVVPRTDPFDPLSIPTLDLVQIWLREELPRSTEPLGEVRAECYGVTVNARDLAQITESDRFRINTLVLAAIFLILVLLVRKAWLAGYLLLTVLFSYYATLGATTLAGHWWNNRPLGEVDWRVPFFLFTILVAVGEDYNILLMSRALRERRRHGGPEGMRRALAQTGGAITSCGLIMAGTFATLILAGLSTLVQIGFALSFGVLLDTFLIRPFLVPAFTVWMWRREERAVLPADTPDEFNDAIRRKAG